VENCFERLTIKEEVKGNCDCGAISTIDGVKR
jgi:hypothetical protein